MISLIDFYIIRPSAIVLSRKNDDPYPHYEFFYNIIEIGACDIFPCNIIYDRVLVFFFYFSKLDAIECGLSLFCTLGRSLGLSKNLMLKIKKKCRLISGFSKSVKQVTKMVKCILNSRCHFLRDYFFVRRRPPRK